MSMLMFFYRICSLRNCKLYLLSLSKWMSLRVPD